MKTIDGYDVKIFTDNVEDEAIEQLRRLVSIPAFSNCKVRVMPDVHSGAGCVIGFTADLGDKVIPNIVGVDIGCGMNTSWFSEPCCAEDLSHLQKVIEDNIPSGMSIRDEGKGSLDPEFWPMYDKARELVLQLRCYRDLKDTNRIIKSIGTLGGGNHFIEVDLSENDEWITYLVIHTGSRNLGKQVADYYQKLAIKNMSGWDKVVEEQKRIIEEYKATGRKSEIQGAIAELHRNYKAVNPDVPDELCWLEGQSRDDYLHDMKLCQEWATINRDLIRSIIYKEMGWNMIVSFETIHNYIDLKSNIIRKGAVSAKKRESLIIPINMRDGSLLCTGKGAPDWNYSAPHGAGRIMSRKKAFETLSLDDFKNSMKGVRTWSVNESTLDEAPMVYKTMEEIINNIYDTVDMYDVIRPIYNFKASGDDHPWKKDKESNENCNQTI